MSKKCPQCQEELLRLPVLIDGIKKDRFIHPEDIYQKCELRHDGIKIHLEIIDEYLFEKFQEIINKEKTRKTLWLKITDYIHRVRSGLV